MHSETGSKGYKNEYGSRRDSLKVCNRNVVVVFNIKASVKKPTAKDRVFCRTLVLFSETLYLFTNVIRAEIFQLHLR